MNKELKMNIILETSRSHPKNEIKIYVSKRTPTRIHASSEILSILHNAAHFIVFVFDVEFLFIPSCYFLLNYIPIWYFEFLHGIFGEIGDLLATALVSYTTALVEIQETCHLLLEKRKSPSSSSESAVVHFI